MSQNNCSKSPEPKRKFKKFSRSAWALKITLITFALAIVCSFTSQLATNGSDIIIAVMLLAFMIVVSIIFDGIGVSVTSCDINDVRVKCKSDAKCFKIASSLIKNAEKVNNICADVIGDMCGILSGACGATIVVKLAADGAESYFVPILVSSLIAALTVGGKAFCKRIAVKNSAEFIVMTARVLTILGKFKPSHRFSRKRKSIAAISGSAAPRNVKSRFSERLFFGRKRSAASRGPSVRTRGRSIGKNGLEEKSYGSSVSDATHSER